MLQSSILGLAIVISTLVIMFAEKAEEEKRKQNYKDFWDGRK